MNSACGREKRRRIIFSTTGALKVEISKANTYIGTETETNPPTNNKSERMHENEQV